MFLDVAQVVQQQFQKAHLTPGETTALTRPRVGQRLDRRPALDAAVVQVGLQLCLGVGSCRNYPRRVQFFKRERSRGRESRDGSGEVQFEPEEGVVSNVPER